MVVFAVTRPKLRVEIGADLGEDASEFFDGRAVEHLPTIFSHKDQVGMHRKNAASTTANVTWLAHRPML